MRGHGRHEGAANAGLVVLVVVLVIAVIAALLLWPRGGTEEPDAELKIDVGAVSGQVIHA